MQAQCQTARMKPFAFGTRRPEVELDQRRWSAVLLDQLLFKLFETGSKKIGGWAQFGRCVLVLLCFPQICSAVQHAKKGCPLVRARMPGLEHRDGLTMLTDHFPFWSLGSRAALMASDKIRNPVPTVDDFLFNINLGRYQAISGDIISQKSSPKSPPLLARPKSDASHHPCRQIRHQCRWAQSYRQPGPFQ